MLSTKRSFLNKLNQIPNFYWVLSIVFVCILLVFFRQPDRIIHAQFWAEDAYFFSDAYNKGPFLSLTFPISGYYVVLQRLVASFAQLLPIVWAPRFFVACALAIQLLPVFILNSGRFRDLFKNRITPAVLSILYVLLPNTAEVFFSVANIQWHLAIAALLVLIAEKPKTIGWQIFDMAVLIICGVTGPFAILLTPIALFLYWKKRDTIHLRNLIAVAGTASIQLFSLLFINTVQRAELHEFFGIAKLIRILGSQIFVGGFLGTQLVETTSNSFVLSLVVLLVVGSLLICCLRRAPLELILFVIFAGMVLGSSLLSSIHSPNFDFWDALTHKGLGQRYYYIPILALYCVAIWGAARHQFTIKIIGILILCVALVGITSDFKITKLKNLEFWRYAHEFRQVPKGTPYIIPINPEGWHMNLLKK